MRKATLLYNPDSGGKGRRRLAELESALAVLRSGGAEAALVPTESKAHAREQTREAINSGCDTIFACGGDGTINTVAQVLTNSQVALAILPMGTANALAYDIGLPLNVIAAAKASLTAKHRRIAVGRVEYVNFKGNPGVRYFVLAAGVGVDAHLFYKLQSGAKQRMGMTAYYAKAWNLWFTYPMTRFVIDYLENGSNAPEQAEVTELLAVRIRNFGGVVQELAPGASLDRDDMRLVFARTASRLAYLGYVIRCLLRRKWSIPGIDLVSSTKVSCRYKASSSASENHRRIYVEADGDLLGTLPAEITIVPDALTLLAPSR
jgi:diacylglycerol kinase family enzyme